MPARPVSLATRPLVPGAASGSVLALDEPLSFWGGLDPETGCIIDRLHPQLGACASGRVVVMPGGRGSSSSSTIVAEAVRLNTAPAAIVLREPDHILVVGSLVARELYGRVVPIFVLSGHGYASLRSGLDVTITATGSLRSVD